MKKSNTTNLEIYAELCENLTRPGSWLEAILDPQGAEHDDLTAILADVGIKVTDGSKNYAAEVLDAILSMDTPDESDKKNKTPFKVGIMDYLEKTEQKYYCGRQVKVADLAFDGSVNYAMKVLSEILGTDVSMVDRYGVDFFYWIGSGQYAPTKIGFELAWGTKLFYRPSDGAFQSPVAYYPAKEFIRKMRKINPELDFCGDIANAYMVYGEARQGARWSFQIRDAEATDKILLIVPWGGPHTTTHGYTSEMAFPEYLVPIEKCSSKGNGKGYDYYLLNVKKFIEEGKIDSRLLKKFLRQQQDEFERAAIKGQLQFAHKVIMIEHIRNRYECAAISFRLVEETYSKLYQQVAGNGLAEMFYVMMPEFEDIERCMPPKLPEEAPYSIPTSELTTYLATDKMMANLVATRSRMETKVAAWEEFAPRYAELFDVIHGKCRGDLLVVGDCARVWLPNNTAEEGAEMIMHEFAFSEFHLNLCIKAIKQFLEHEESWREENKNALPALLAK